MSLRSLFGGIVADTPVPYTSRWKGSGLALGAGRSMGRTEQLRQYEEQSTLYGIVSKLASMTSLVNWKLWRPAASGLDEDRTEVAVHAARKVWDRPNEFFTRQELAETCQQHLDLTGEAAMVVTRAGRLPIELWPVRPDRIVPVQDVTKFIAGYIYVSPDGEKIALRREDVIFIRYPSPLDIYRGVSALPSLAGVIGQSRAQISWNEAFFQNSAQPGGVIMVDRRMTDDEFDELADRWNKQHKGAANAGRVAILEQATFTPIVVSQKDMQYVETHGLTKQALLDAYGFPKFGLGDVDDVNRATATASLALMAQTLTVPRLERWKGALNFDFLPMFGVQPGALEFDYEDPVPPDTESENATLTAKSNAVVALVGAGFDADEACDAVGLPRMLFEKPEPLPVKVPSELGDGGQKELEPA